MGCNKTCGFVTLVLLASLCSNYVQCADVPVFIWGKPSVTYVPALSKYSSSEFGALVESQMSEETFTVVFVEDRMSTEDFTQCKLNTHTCFRNLAKIDRKSYLPSVEDPLVVFDDETGNIQHVQLADDGSLSEEIVPKGGNTVIISLTGQDYALHDTVMNNVYNKLRAEFSNILSIYTSKASSFKSSNLIRRTRQVTEAPPVKVNVLNNTRFIIAYENISAGPVEALVPITLDSIHIVDVNSTDDERLQIDLQNAGAKLSFFFLLSQGSWEVVGVTYDNAHYYMRHRIHINQYFSFHCNNLEYYTPDGKKKIVFEELQMQPYWPKTRDDQVFTKFGDAWDCVGFTSPAILTGLFLVVIFIFIGALGITWMMDMRTMDRFDDPKGKTITVTTAE